MRILIVEDERELALAIKEGLELAGFLVEQAFDGHAGLTYALQFDYDAIVLDLLLPRLDGWAFLDALRAEKRTPVLVLTARDAVSDKIRCLDGGADDYLTKPFDLEELLARVRAIVRRASGHATAVIEVGDLRIDTAARTVHAGSSELSLTPMEYSLLELLALHRGSLVTRTMIYEHLWGQDDQTWSNVVDVYVSTLRAKLGRDVIATRRGLGYIIP